MVAEVELRRLAVPYRSRFGQALMVADQTVTRLYVATAPTDVDLWVTTAVPVVQGLQQALIALAQRYTASQLELFTPTRPVRLVDVADELLVRTDTPWLRSPMLRERRLVAVGLPPSEARQRAAGYAGDLMTAEARVTERAAATATYRQHWDTRAPLKYRRILEGGACGWCRVVADRLYSADDSGKWHAHCRCTWRLITPAEAEAHEPKFTGDRWKDVINERATRPVESRRQVPDLTPVPAG